MWPSSKLLREALVKRLDPKGRLFDAISAQSLELFSLTPEDLGAAAVEWQLHVRRVAKDLVQSMQEELPAGNAAHRAYVMGKLAFERYTAKLVSEKGLGDFLKPAAGAAK
jgi:hypothetical protein